MKYLLTILVVLTVQIASAQWFKTKGPGGGVVHTLYTDGTKVYAGTESGGAFVSHDSGNSWESISNGFTSSGTVKSFLRHNGILFAGAGAGVFKSINDGQSWESSSSGMVIKEIRQLASAGNLLIACTRGAQMYWSDNNGTSWTQMGGQIHSDVYCFLRSGSDWLAGASAGGI